MNNKIDLGTEISAEMYSVSNKMKLKKKLKKNTFQQSTPSATTDYVNVDRAAPDLLASQAPSGPGVRENQEVRENRFGRQITKNDLIVDMTCCLAKIRTGNRYHRVNAYFSIKTDTDLRYMIFLRSSLTTAHDEIFRSIDKAKNLPLRSVAETFIDEHPENLLLGRVRYKPTNKYITEQHRANLKYGLMAIWIENNEFKGELFLNGEYYHFDFHDDLSPEQVKAQYSLMGQYTLDEGEIE